MTRFRTILFGACALAASAAAADPLHGEAQRPDSKYTDISAYLVPPAASLGAPPSGSGRHVSVVDQTGAFNQATADLRGAGNVSVQAQFGARNQSTIDIQGANNALSTLQIGVGNSVDLSVNGQNNTINQSQIGANLSYSLNQTGAGKSVTVQQFGVR